MLIFTIIALFEHSVSNCSSQLNSWCVGDLEANKAGGLKGLKLHRSLGTVCYKNVQEIPDGQIYESGEATIKKKSLNDTNINLPVKEFARPVDMAVS